MHKTGGFLHIQQILRCDTKRARRDKECAPQHLGESEAQRLIFQIAPTNVQHCTYAWESRTLLNSEASACNLGITFFARLIAVGDNFIP